MTAYSQIANRRKRRNFNKKDGDRRPPRLDFESHGFERIDWNAYDYTWAGDFPVFRLSPGATLNGRKLGLIARCEGIEILFPYGAEPAFIKSRLDDEILQIMRHDAELVEAEFDIDQYMADELDRPLWYHSPAIDKLMDENGLSREEAADMFKERD
jgi:hypothetical protein